MSDPIINEVVFSDLKTTFTAHPVNGKPPVLKNAAAIQNAIRNLILTDRFEVPYNPIFGTFVKQHLFEILDPITEANIEEDIKVAIKNFEPRVDVQDVIITSYPDENRVTVAIEYFIVNDAEPSQVTIDIERIR